MRVIFILPEGGYIRTKPDQCLAKAARRPPPSSSGILLRTDCTAVAFSSRCDGASFPLVVPVDAAQTPRTQRVLVGWTTSERVRLTREVNSLWLGDEHPSYHG